MPKPSYHRPITKEEPFSICFVCLGNICRSPTAEGVMQYLVKERGLADYFYIDSAGTAAYHIGEPANSKSQKVANSHGVTLHSRGRQFVSHDFQEFDLILTMDEENYHNALFLDSQNQYSHKLMMMREFDPDPDNKNVPDPYYGGMDGFEHVYQVLFRSCNALLLELEGNVVKNQT